jgi:hypothetical protein
MKKQYMSINSYHTLAGEKHTYETIKRNGKIYTSKKFTYDVSIWLHPISNNKRR